MRRVGRARPRMYFPFDSFLYLFYVSQGDGGWKAGMPHYDGASSGVGKGY